MDTILRDLIPAKIRLWIYVIVFFALLVFSVWQASEGNIAEFVGALLASLVQLLAATNVNVTPELTDLEKHADEISRTYSPDYGKKGVITFDGPPVDAKPDALPGNPAVETTLWDDENPR